MKQPISIVYNEDCIQGMKRFEDNFFDWTEKTIQKALFKKFESHSFKFTNTYFFKNESDWLSFLSNGYCYEVEIKISRSDFKADFKKIKHKLHKNVNEKDGLYAHPLREIKHIEPDWNFCKAFPELVESNEYYNGRSWFVRLWAVTGTQIEFRKVKPVSLPNKFFYAVPENLISIDEIPDYAGLLYIKEDGSVKKVKDGKFIHREILNKSKLFNKLYFAYEKQLANSFKNL